MGRSLALLLSLVVATADVDEDNGIEPTQQPTDITFTPLCSGPWRDVSDEHRYRGIAPEDNGHTTCCPLDRAFLCIVGPGHQHGPVIRVFARFYDDTHLPQPRVTFPFEAHGNPGMAPDPGAPPPPVFAQLRLTRVGTNDFVLQRTKQEMCRGTQRPPRGSLPLPIWEIAPVCRAEGRYRLLRGVPSLM